MGNDGGRGDALSVVRKQVMWTRLISVVEEQAKALIRTAFGTPTREAGDLSAGVFLPDGRMVAQAVTGTPGHVNSMAESVRHFLRVFPLETMSPGDAYLTNDPWKGTGHLFDMTMVSPVFHRGRAIALFAATLHVVDIGGISPSPEGAQVFHEGLFLPIVRFVREGVVDPSIIAIVRANVREPEQVEGDLHALVACNEVGGRRLVDMLVEFDVADIDALGGWIIERSRRAMIEALDEWPRGTWHNAMTIDGYEAPIEIVAALTIADDGITIDFTGTSPFVSRGINVVKAYTDAYTSFGIRCLIGSTIPNNAGSLEPIVVRAPEGSIVNAPFPAAVTARHVIGQMLPDVVIGCLRQARPETAPAEGSSALWNIQLSGGRPFSGGSQEDLLRSRPFTITSFSTGGTGARPRADGLSTTSYPSGVRNVSVEILETVSPLVFWRKEYRTDSGGPGAHRGGLGQVIEISHADRAAMVLSAAWDRIEFPARGDFGGLPGGNGGVALRSGRKLRGKGQQVVPAGEYLVVETPGGGGLGDPRTRDRRRVAQDLEAELISSDAARDIYGLDVS